MIKRRLINCSYRFRHHLGICSVMAAVSNFMCVQKDFQMLSLRGLSSNASTSSAIGASNGRFLFDGFRVKACGSENYGNVLRNSGEFDIDRGNSVNGVRKARAYAPSLLRVSEEVVRVEDQRNCVSTGGVNGVANRGNLTGVLDQALSERVMIAVDVDEVLGNFVSALNQFVADRYSLNHSISEYHVYEFFKVSPDSLELDLVWWRLCSVVSSRNVFC